MRKILSILAAAVSIVAVGAAGAAGAAEVSVRAADLASGTPRMGFTEVVPPYGIRQYFSASERDGGLLHKMQGVELSIWQTVPMPDETRSKLDWHFEYEGEIVRGYGRAGLIFGSESGANLLSVEVTAFGSLRVMRWGMDVEDPSGVICYAMALPEARGKRVRLSVDYSMRDGLLVCSVNGGREISIELKRYMASGPMTIKHAGFFAAVPEAEKSADFIPFTVPYDIDLSDKYAEVLHRSLSVSTK